MVGASNLCDPASCPLLPHGDTAAPPEPFAGSGDCMGELVPSSSLTSAESVTIPQPRGRSVQFTPGSAIQPGPVLTISDADKFTTMGNEFG